MIIIMLQWKQFLIKNYLLLLQRITYLAMRLVPQHLKTSNNEESKYMQSWNGSSTLKSEKRLICYQEEERIRQNGTWTLRKAHDKMKSSYKFLFFQICDDSAKSNLFWHTNRSKKTHHDDSDWTRQENAWEKKSIVCKTLLWSSISQPLHISLLYCNVNDLSPKNIEETCLFPF